MPLALTDHLAAIPCKIEDLTGREISKISSWYKLRVVPTFLRTLNFVRIMPIHCTSSHIKIKWSRLQQRHLYKCSEFQTGLKLNDNILKKISKRKVVAASRTFNCYEWTLLAKAKLGKASQVRVGYTQFHKGAYWTIQYWKEEYWRLEMGVVNSA